MRHRSTNLALVAIAGLLFWQAGARHDALLAQRAGMVPGEASVLESMPPVVAFTTVALGGFRGMIADLLWLRASRMQEQGRYFELVQLSNWITALEPRFAQVWAYHAWNMAYNISVLFADDADRWRWVRHGISLLRDKGLLYNPGEADLYHELAWFFQHKLGEEMDSAHLYYKRSWAEEMSRLFEGRGPDYAAMSTLPETRDELLASPDVASLVADLRGRNIRPLDPEFLRQLENDPELAARFAAEPGAEKLLAFVQRETLQDVYRLDLQRMAEAEAEYGRMDWRMPYAHAVYWAREGLPHAEEFDHRRLRRVIYQSLFSAFRKGFAFYDVDGRLVPSPDFDLLDPVLAELNDFLVYDPGLAATFRNNYRQFLTEIVVLLYAHGRTEQADKVFDSIASEFPGPDTEAGLRSFVMQHLGGPMDQLSRQEALTVLQNVLANSYSLYAIGAEDRAAGYYSIAVEYYAAILSAYGEPDALGRTNLPPFRDLARAALRQVADDNFGPQGTQRLGALREAAATGDVALPALP